MLLQALEARILGSHTSCVALGKFLPLCLGFLTCQPCGVVVRMKQEAAWSGTGTCLAIRGWCPLPSDASSEGVAATHCCLGAGRRGWGGQVVSIAAPQGLSALSDPPDRDSQACPVERRAVCGAVSRKLPEIHPPRTTPPEGVLGRMTPFLPPQVLRQGPPSAFLGVANWAGPAPGEEKDCVPHSHSLWGCDGVSGGHAHLSFSGKNNEEGSTCGQSRELLGDRRPQ